MIDDADDIESGYPELLSDLADQVATKLSARGVAADLAAELGLAVAEHVREHWSGQSIYLPKGQQFDLSRRDMEIWRDFNGRNQETLARAHNLTVMRIYQIVKRVRAEMIKRRQGSLFEEVGS